MRQRPWESFHGLVKSGRIDEVIDPVQRVRRRGHHPGNVHGLELADQVLRRGLYALEARRNRWDLLRLEALWHREARRDVGVEVQLNEQQTGEYALGRELGAQTASDKVLDRLGVVQISTIRSEIRQLVVVHLDEHRNADTLGHFLGV